jgi:hypothetical protein
MKLTKIYTYWSTLGGVFTEPMMFITYCDRSEDDGKFGHQEHVVDIDVVEPSKADAVQAVVAELKARQAEHRVSIAQIDDRINSLLCIEHKEEVQ